VNGCLIRIIVIILVFIIITSIAVNNSDYAKEKFDKLNNITEIIKKIIRYKK